MFRIFHPATCRAGRDVGTATRRAPPSSRDDGVGRWALRSRLALFTGAGIAGAGLDLLIYFLAQWRG